MEDSKTCTKALSVKLDLQKNNKKLIKLILGFYILIQLNLILLDVVFNFNKLINYNPIRQLFNMELEDSLANWISSLVYLSVALAAWAIVCKERFLLKKKLNTLIWTIIAAGFTYLAADDGAGIHERVGTTLKLFYDKNSWNPEYQTLHWVMNTFPSYYWQVVFIPILSIFAIFTLIFFWRTLASFKLFFLVGLAFGFMCFAQGLDYLEGIHYKFEAVQNLFGLEYKTVRHYFKVFEEFLEMCGMTTLLGVFLAHFFSGLESILIKLEKNKSE